MPLPLPINTEQLEQLVEAHGTPLQLYDETGIRMNARHLFKAFKAHFPSFKQYYAVKALPNPAVLQVLIDEGCGLDCSSTSELYIAEKLKVAGADTMYTSNYTSKGDLKIAAEQGAVVNLDDLSLVKHLQQVADPFPELISFRLNPGLGRTDSETKSNVLGGPDAKFGVPPFQIVECYRQAKEAGATRFGIHMMTGSCVTNSEYWKDTVQVLVETMEKINNELGIHFEFMNIGGGLGIPYRLEEARVDVVEIAAMLRTKFDELDVKRFGVDNKEPNLYMENGRYMTGPYGWLVAKCHAVKDTYEVYYGLDACMSNLMRPGMYGAYHHISVPTAENRTDQVKNANVVGTLCENNDWFGKQRSLPVAQEGDLFVIYDTGAHAHSMGFQYNGKLRAPEVLIRFPNSEATLIRDRETIEDLYTNTHLLEDVAESKDKLDAFVAEKQQQSLEMVGDGDQVEEEEGCVIQ